ncbi:MAG TPA: hypothetical protein PLD20_30520 [Blastocatellia bacterium]|nr:hypothetical protein [Blastocatellia bacterium]HMV87966.1 hypothetical protein [Blastocatellia bacterium]HMX24310.1 hypothetical protein [Blastocatellia bacterium]HMY75334.1 hypothetical protein [Blastocatellia bacterium]HMZ22306.1 hypothetical protein [Blastocatellia bacterium]
MMNFSIIRQAVVCAALAVISCIGASAAFKPAFAAQPDRTHCMQNAAAPAAARYCSGVRNALNEHRLSAEQLSLIALRLREITGWQSLAFDEDGFLVCPEPQAISGGSAAARKLLGAALSGEAAYELESHPRSSVVKFARLANRTVYVNRNSALTITSYPVQIDFKDFRFLQGEASALAAFDPGIALLHELAHGVWDLPDAQSEADEPGACESYINQIRRELHLPERQHYKVNARHRLNSLLLLAELHFIQFTEKNGRLRRKRFFLRWGAPLVGDLDDARLAAAVVR